jgi:hypothetical protein
MRRSGYAVAGFDLAGGADVLDPAAVRSAARGCAAIVHLAALPHDTAGSPEQIMAVNVLGTWHVLLAAEAAALIDCSAAASALGWRAAYRWSRRGKDTADPLPAR